MVQFVLTQSFNPNTGTFLVPFFLLVMNVVKIYIGVADFLFVFF